MGHRISQVYTRTGDQGSTSDALGTRLSKNSPQIELLGTLDELNSSIGVLLAEALPTVIATLLTRIQHQLFEAGAEISQPGSQRIQPVHIEAIESAIDDINAQIPPLEEFILPGGKNGAAFCHLIRSTCRRVERIAVHYHHETNQLLPNLLAYLNRLSDLFFVMARYLARQKGESEVLWSPDANH